MTEYEIVKDELYEVHEHLWNNAIGSEVSGSWGIPIGYLNVLHECTICGYEKRFKGFFDGRSVEWVKESDNCIKGETS